MKDDIVSRKMASYGITPLPEKVTVAMAYVPYQIDSDTCSEEQGMNMGTMFPVLNKPFIGCGGDKE